MDASFKVVYSSAVRNKLKDLLTQTAAMDKDFAQSVLRAVQIIDRRLSENPRDFGELRYRLSFLQLEMRIAVVAPIAVQFGVHGDQPLVFVTKHDLLGSPGD